MIKHVYFTRNLTKMENKIENMRNEGYILTGVYPGRNRLEFQKNTSDEYIPKVRIDYQSFKRKTDFENYLALFEDSGWQHMFGTRHSGTQVFQQASPNAPDDIFSDRASKAERYKRVSFYWLSLFAAYIPLLIVFCNTSAFNLYNLFHLKNMYFTPGLWERTGISFWKGFLFETPFALARCFGGILFFIIIIGYLCAAAKSYYWYCKEKKQQY